jgi:PAS domain S-box-containing protein
MSKKILAVDDDDSVLKVIERTICADEEGSYELITSDSGSAAVECIKNEQPDLIITAIDIDAVDGLDIVNEAHKNEIPVIILSSRTDPETVGMIKAYYKPKFYMTKPLESRNLLKNIKQIFEEKGVGLPHHLIPKFWEELCDNAPYGITVVDKDLNIRFVNKALEKRGINPNDVVGKKIHMVFDNMEKPNESHPSLKAIKSGTANTIEKKGDDNHNYRITSIPIKDDDGNNSFVIEISEDLGKD